MGTNATCRGLALALLGTTLLFTSPLQAGKYAMKGSLELESKCV